MQVRFFLFFSFFFARTFVIIIRILHESLCSPTGQMFDRQVSGASFDYTAMNTFSYGGEELLGCAIDPTVQPTLIVRPPVANPTMQILDLTGMFIPKPVYSTRVSLNLVFDLSQLYVTQVLVLVVQGSLPLERLVLWKLL